MINQLKRLFRSGEPKKTSDSDPEALHFYVQCDKCGSQVHLRVHKEHDLNREGGGFVWHKTIVDSRCFRPMPTVVHLDSQYQVIQAEIEGGRYITEAEYQP